MAGVAAHGSTAGVREPAADDRCRARTLCGSEVALHCLEGQVALLHHVMAFEEANSGRKILSDTQRWKAQFAAYFLGAVSQGQLSLLERTTTDTAGVAYARRTAG